jgi:uncharacterized protein YaaQ
MKKLVIAVIQNEVADTVVDALLEADFRTTRLASTGGFLRRGNTTLMIGADESQVDYVLDLIRQTARSGMAPPDSGEGIPPAAATVFVLDLEEYQRLSGEGLQSGDQGQRMTVPRSSVWYSIRSPATSTETRYPGVTTWA